MQPKLQLIKLKNPFNRYSRDISAVEYMDGQSLLDIRNSQFSAVPVVTSLNGRVINVIDLALVKPQPGDCIVFVPELQGGGGDSKQIIGMVAMIALVIATSGVAAPGGMLFGAAMSTTASLGLYGAGSIVLGVMTAGVLIAGGMLINSFMPKPQIPSMNLPNAMSDFDRTQTYSWSPQTTQQQGTVIPKFYGTNKLYGNIIASYIEYINDKQYINALICLGFGPFKSFSDKKINDQPIENFADIIIEERLGLLNQSIISNFNNTKTEYPLSVKITQGAPYTYLTVNNAFDEAEIDITFPQGLYYANDSGGLSAHSINLKIEKKKVGDSVWTEIVNETVAGAQTASLRRTYKTGALTQGQYEFRISNLTADQTSSRYGDDMYLSALREVYYDDFEYPRHALIGIKALASDQISGSLKFSCLAECAKVRIWDGAQWSIDVSSSPAWVAWDLLTRPVFDNNLNIVRYDGYNPSRLDLVKFKDWADFCDALVPDGKGGTEKRITFNGGFDADTTVWEAFLAVCQLGRAVPVINGLGITLWIDKATDATMTFTAGNITLDSFKETFLPVDERATEIEVDFVNAENDYNRDKFSVLNPNITDKINKISMQLIGCTKPSEAWRHAAYKLANNQYLTRTAQISASADAIGCLIGDRINVAHEVPQWGYSGRLVSAASGSVTLDRKVTIENGKSYAVMLVFSVPSMVTHNSVNYVCKLAHTAGALNAPGVGADWAEYWETGGDGSSGAWTTGKQYVHGDYAVERTVTNTPGEYETLLIDLSGIDLPRKYDNYSFGEINKIIKPFRVLDIQPTQDLEHTLYLIEYNESVYGVDNQQPALPTPDYSSLDPLPSVSGLKLEERLLKALDGTLRSTIDVYFNAPNSSSYRQAEIWFQKDSIWTYSGISLSGKYTIENVEEGKTYTVAVISVNIAGQKQNIQNATQDSLYIFGKTAKPADITEFWGQASIGGLRLDWTAIADVDLDYYKIRFTPDTVSGTWDNAIDVATAYSTSISLPAALDGKYLIKAVDTSGNESVNAKALITTIPTILAWNAQEELIEDPAFGGVKTDMYVDAGELYLGAAGMFDDIADFDSIISLDRYGGTEQAGYYETDAVNLGSVQTCRCSANVKFQGINAEGMFDDIADFDAITSLDGDISEVGVILQIALSQDGSTWGAWQNFFAGDYTAKAFKFRVKAYSDHQAQYLKIIELEFYVDMPDRIESGQDIVIPSGGQTINFAKSFMVKPKIGITIQSANAGDYYDLQSASATQFAVQIKNSAGTGIEKTIDWEARAY